MRTLTTGLLICLTLLAVALGALMIRSPVQIDTDLKSLAPKLNQAVAVTEAVDSVTAAAALQVTIVLASDDEDALYEANEALAHLLEQDRFALRYADQSELLDRYVGILAEHPYALLTEAAAQALRSMSDQQLLQQAKLNLFGQSGNVRLLPIPQDPFGYVNQYALQALMHMSAAAGDDIALGDVAGETRYYSAHSLQLPADALHMQAQSRVISEISTLERVLREQHPGLSVLHSGMVFFAASAAQSARADISLISTGSAIGVLLLLLLVFRSVRALILPALSVIGGSLFAFLLCYRLFDSIHILTIVFGASLIGVVIDYSLHFFYLFDQNKPASERHLYRALFLSLLTSVIGYGALSLSGLPALQQIALFSALGLIYAFLLVVTLGRYFGPGVQAHDGQFRAVLITTFAGLRAVPTRFIVLALFMLALLLGFLSELKIPSNDSPKAFFTTDAQLLEQEQQISKLTASYEPATFVVIDGDSVEQVFTRISQLRKHLGSTGDTLAGMDNLLPSPATQTEHYALNARLFGDAGLISDFINANALTQLSAADYVHRYQQAEARLLLPEQMMAELGATLPPLWVTNAGRMYAFLLIPKGADIAQIQDVASQLENAKILSAVAETSQALTKLRQASLQLLLVALVAVAALMCVRYGMRRGLQLVLVPGMTIVITLLTLASFNIPITLFHSMALFLVLGLGMDYVIFAAEIPEQYDHVLAAIALSAATSLLSFGLLSLSSLPAVSAFGLTVLIGNSINLLGCFVLSSRWPLPTNNT